CPSTTLSRSQAQAAMHPALEDLAQMQAMLQRWQQRRWLRALDVQLPQTLHQLAGETNPLLWLLCALLCHQYGRGHSCILLQDLLHDPDGLLSLPPQNQFLQRFTDRPSVVLKGLKYADYRTALTGSSWLATDSAAPLVLHDDRLYLYRLFQAEQRVKQHLTDMLSNTQPLSTNVAKTLDQLFPLQPQTEQSAPDWQRL